MKICFLIGAARSGTSMLGGQILSKHPDIIYIGERDYLWQESKGFKKGDVILESEYEDKIADRLRTRMQKISEKSPGKLLLEKTPSNCFRIGYLNKVFPECKFIHIIRDGREVSLSSSKEWGAKKTNALDGRDVRNSKLPIKLIKTINRKSDISNRFKSFTDIKFLPIYFLKLFSYLKRQVFKTDKHIWGPRFPGIKQVRKRYSLLETCAIQWERSVVAAESSLNLIDNSRVLNIKYEELLEAPHSCLSKIVEFLEIENSELLISNLSSKIIKGNSSKWQNELTESEKKMINSHISFTLNSLGYN